MDLYRYFHPHHNPRLKDVPVRLQELAELEQAAIELRSALRRAEIRTQHAPVGGIECSHFSEILVAMDYIVESLSTLSTAHPGDAVETMLNVLKERKDAPGWENWCRLLQQRVKNVNEYDGFSVAPPSADQNPADSSLDSNTNNS